MTKVIAADEGSEAEVGEARGKNEEELDHHVVGAMGGGIGEDKMGGGGDEDTQQEEEGQGDHCISNYHERSSRTHNIFA